jgi:hypothetical protein
MVKRKPTEGEETAAAESPDTSAPSELPAGGEGSAATAPPKSKWVSHFGSYGDYEVGVRLIEDRINRRMTIQFQEKPPEAIRAVLKGDEYGYRFDAQDQLWYKPINQDKPRQSRQEAEELVHKVANMIRQDKGLEQKESFARGV